MGGSCLSLMEGVITILLLYSAPEIKKKKAQRVLFQMFFFSLSGKNITFVVRNDICCIVSTNSLSSGYLWFCRKKRIPSELTFANAYCWKWEHMPFWNWWFATNTYLHEVTYLTDISWFYTGKNERVVEGGLYIAIEVGVSANKTQINNTTKSNQENKVNK